jgi:hypothetical protein
MSEHVVPFQIYAVIFATLLLLTLVTVDVATYNFGMMNIYIALAVATTPSSRSTTAVATRIRYGFSPVREKNVQVTYAPIIRSSPCAKLTVFITPKIRFTPVASRM